MCIEWKFDLVKHRVYAFLPAETLRDPLAFQL